MKTEFVRCELCRAEIPADACGFAAYKAVIDGKEYVFCCPKCADRFKRKEKKM